MMIQTQQEHLKEATEDLPFPGRRNGVDVRQIWAAEMWI